MTGHDMSRYWRLVNNDGGLITGTWWVTRPDDKKGTSHVKPIDVVMWSEGRHHGLTLKPDDFTAFVTDGVVEPISIRARHDHVQSEAGHRLAEIEAVVLTVIAAAEWPNDEAAES
ncbi:hypothetical protein J2X46_002735 [Nocardioides sp. BE266]|uniref:hypothetical protein n=1 Tax=Nocardioides sp. BE266 TaxID=2817725 RepID=UPI002856C274|nr:hypothetical protein [Nocardioides sp. BE266]MDR7253745.1 hypothetical protein [Nocardioides sp. BE266]